jgi:chromosome segregation ATPase
MKIEPVTSMLAASPDLLDEVERLRAEVSRLGQVIREQKAEMAEQHRRREAAGKEVEWLRAVINEVSKLIREEEYGESLALLREVKRLRADVEELKRRADRAERK